MSLIQFAQMTEAEARNYLEKVRWNGNPVCPHCGSLGAYKLTAKEESAKPVRDSVYKCKSCLKQYSVTTSTVMHGSHIPLKKWVLAFYLMCSSKKGISALQLQRNLDLGSYKTAWHMAHRIRLAMKEEPLKALLSGDVEVDETYVGGKSREARRGRGSERKIPVMVLVERDGKAVSKPVKRVDADTLQSAIKESVDKNSRIITDEWSAYRGIGKEFDGGHDVIKHLNGVYIDGDIYTNTAESFFALLKRGIHGIFHHVDKEHLSRYCDEFVFRWNYREVTDDERTDIVVKNIFGKRLKYKMM